MLTTILGNADALLAEEGHGPEVRSDLEDIRGAAERAAVLTRRLLTLTRRDIAQPIDLNFNDLIRENAPSLQRMIGPNIELVSLLAEPLGPVRMDPAQAEQVLLNLVVNAKDAMPRGGKLVMETEFVPADPPRDDQQGNGHETILRVSDTGEGMSDEVKSRIFDPFFSTKADGSGLGLATVLGIVSQWGGTVRVQSAPGSGAIFEIRLPAKPAGDAESTEDPDLDGAVDPCSGTVLVVDDEPTIRAFVKKSLEKAGCRVVESENGASAYQVLQDNPFEFDVLLTDLVMPIMGGFALAEKVRSINPDLPVIFMSGYAEEVAVDRELPATRRPFLKKPFKPSELVAMVRTVMEAATRD
jgi:CheY-like chemotaxis protein